MHQKEGITSKRRTTGAIDEYGPWLRRHAPPDIVPFSLSASREENGNDDFLWSGLESLNLGSRVCPGLQSLRSRDTRSIASRWAETGRLKGSRLGVLYIPWRFNLDGEEEGRFDVSMTGSRQSQHGPLRKTRLVFVSWALLLHSRTRNASIPASAHRI